jgi:hypothetical protein
MIFLELYVFPQNSGFLKEKRHFQVFGLSFFRIVRQKSPFLIDLKAIFRNPIFKSHLVFMNLLGFISHLFVFLAN